MSYGGTTEEVDLEQYPNAKALVDRCKDFFAEVEDLYVSFLRIPFDLH